MYAARIWKGDIWVSDIKELENLDASEIHARRFDAKAIFTPKNGEHFIFPIADGTVKSCFGGDHGTRKTTLIRDQPERGEWRVGRV